MILEPVSLFGPAAARDALRQEAEHYVARAALMIGRARKLVLNNREQAIHLLTARRLVLADHLQRYQRFKHSRIFDPVVQHGKASSKVVARTMKIDCMELGEVFAAYHTRWLRLTAPDWPSYREDMLFTVDTLLKNLEAELRAMRQLLMISEFYSSSPPSLGGVDAVDRVDQ